MKMINKSIFYYNTQLFIQIVYKNVLKKAANLVLLSTFFNLCYYFLFTENLYNKKVLN